MKATFVFTAIAQTISARSFTEDAAQANTGHQAALM
jgi:hypothetical protein